MRSFTSFDGLDIAYEVFGPEHGPAVLMHHGFITSGRANWVDTGIVNELTRAGRRAVVIDARGHGSSAKPHDAAAYGEDKMARDLLDLADLLRLAEFDLIGYSMGAVVILLAAAQDSRVNRLITGGVGASVAEIGGVDGSVIAGKELVAGLLADDLSSITDPQAMAFRMFAEASNADRRAVAAQAIATHRRPIRLDLVRVPALILAGADDQLARRPETLAAALPDGTCRVLVGDHLTVVRNPEFAAAIVNFLTVQGL